MKEKPPKKPGRPRTRGEPWSSLGGLYLPVELHEAIIEAAKRQRESISEWLRGAALARLRREGVPVVPPDKDGDGNPPLVVG
jgi:hypothetical protein